VRGFNDGVSYAPDVGSCYSCAIKDSTISANNRIGIYAQKYTNNLVIDNTSFGGAPTLKGLVVTDSASPKVVNSDCEGCSVSAIEIDNPTVATQFAALISGCHFEGNTASNGDIDLGASGMVYGVVIQGCGFWQNASAPCSINARNVNGLAIIGNGRYD